MPATRAPIGPRLLSANARPAARVRTCPRRLAPALVAAGLVAVTGAAVLVPPLGAVSADVITQTGTDRAADPPPGGEAFGRRVPRPYPGSSPGR